MFAQTALSKLETLTRRENQSDSDKMVKKSQQKKQLNLLRNSNACLVLKMPRSERMLLFREVGHEDVGGAIGDEGVVNIMDLLGTIFKIQRGLGEGGEVDDFPYPSSFVSVDLIRKTNILLALRRLLLFMYLKEPKKNLDQAIELNCQLFDLVRSRFCAISLSTECAVMNA